MLKLNLGTHSPTLSEVVTQVNYCMRNIETTMARVILVLVCQTVTAYVVAIEVAAHGNLAITTHAEALAVYMLHHTIGSHRLCTCRCQTSNEGSGHQSNS